MGKVIRGTGMTVGLDLGDRFSLVVVLDRDGGVVEEGRVGTTEAALRQRFSGCGRMRIALETGTHSPWVSRVLEECGHEVIVANSRKLRLIYENPNKDDQVDATYLARLARLDPSLLSPVKHRGATVQNDRIKGLEKQLEVLCDQLYPQTKLLRQVGGIGPVTSLAYVLTLEAPERFKKSRTVGAFVGLVPGRKQSGSSDPQRRITKQGDDCLRRLLVNAAHYILGPFGPDCDLRRFGSRIASRGGKNAKKRAIVAVARKLAVLLHRLWRSAEVYEPLYQENRKNVRRGKVA